MLVKAHSMLPANLCQLDRRCLVEGLSVPGHSVSFSWVEEHGSCLRASMGFGVFNPGSSSSGSGAWCLHAASRATEPSALTSASFVQTPSDSGP